MHHANGKPNGKRQAKRLSTAITGLRDGPLSGGAQAKAESGQ
jgi:hypothetical protein